MKRYLRQRRCLGGLDHFSFLFNFGFRCLISNDNLQFSFRTSVNFRKTIELKDFYRRSKSKDAVSKESHAPTSLSSAALSPVVRAAWSEQSQPGQVGAKPSASCQRLYDPSRSRSAAPSAGEFFLSYSSLRAAQMSCGDRKQTWFRGKVAADIRKYLETDDSVKSIRKSSCSI